MTDAERKIEAALDAYFKIEGWSLDNSGGDHIASCCSHEDHDEVVVNTTECAKHIASELALC